MLTSNRMIAPASDDDLLGCSKIFFIS